MYPESFPNDSDGRKARLKADVEASLKAMMLQRQLGTLSLNKHRFPAYSKQGSPLFADDPELFGDED